MHVPESKFRETIRYLGYTLAAFASMVVVWLVVLLVSPVIAVILTFLVCVAIVGIAVVVVATAYFLFIKKD